MRYTNRPHRQVITMNSKVKQTTSSPQKEYAIWAYEQHRIPGVLTLSHYSLSNSVLSLDWTPRENSFEFFMATQGSVTLSTQTSTYKFSGGDIMLTFPNERLMPNRHPVTAVDLYCFQLNISDENNFLFLTPYAARAIISQLLEIPHHIIQTEAAQTSPLLKNAFHQAILQKNPLLAATYLQLFLQLLIFFSKEERFRLSPDIGRTLDYILEHIEENISLEDLAALSHLSCSQYKQKFKRQMGFSPRYFINQQKIEFSKTLLMEGMSVTDIAMLLNFNTSSYFSTVFKKFTALSPMDYLKKQQDS